MRVYMQHFAEEEAPRFYQLWLQEDLINGWTLLREWGRTGAKGRVKQDHFNSHEEALAALERVRDAQLQRGFKIMYVRGAEVSAADTCQSDKAGMSSSRDKPGHDRT